MKHRTQQELVTYLFIEHMVSLKYNGRGTHWD